MDSQSLVGSLSFEAMKNYVVSIPGHALALMTLPKIALIIGLLFLLFVPNKLLKIIVVLAIIVLVLGIVNV